MKQWRNLAILLAVLTILGIACSTGEANEVTLSTSGSPTSTTTTESIFVGSATTTTVSPQDITTTTTSAPSTTRAPIPGDLVWFAPNMGSVDFTDLFDKPGEWTEAREETDVFKFYIQNVLRSPCRICGGNRLDAFLAVNAFRLLEQWDLVTAIEAGTVKEWGCEGNQGFRNVDLAIRNVAANGGKVSIVAMDEPLLGGQHNIGGLTCDMTPQQIAGATANFARQLQSAHPEVVLGDIEPYPHFSAEELIDWIRLLMDEGVTPEFFHLDVDTERVRVEGQDVDADLTALEEFTEENGIEFGVIFISNWREASSNQSYYESTMQWISNVSSAIGRPSHVIFQSWQGPAPSGAHEVPDNLPPNEGVDYSHSRLLIDGLDVIGS